MPEVNDGLVYSAQTILPRCTKLAENSWPNMEIESVLQLQ